MTIKGSIRSALLAIGIGGAVLLSACGGEDLSPQEFGAKADEICLGARGEFNDLQKQGSPTSSREAADLTRRLVEIAEAELDAVDELNPPEQLQSQVDRYLSARREAIEVMRQGLDAAEEEDERGYVRAQAEVAEGQTKRLKLAKQAGLSECSRPLSADG